MGRSLRDLIGVCFPSKGSTSAFVTGHLEIFSGSSCGGHALREVCPEAPAQARKPCKAPEGQHETQGGVWKLSEWSPGFHGFIASNHTYSPKKGGREKQPRVCPPAASMAASLPSRRRHIRCPCARPSFSRKGLSAVARPAAPLQLCLGVLTRVPHPDPLASLHSQSAGRGRSSHPLLKGSRARPAPRALPARIPVPGMQWLHREPAGQGIWWEPVCEVLSGQRCWWAALVPGHVPHSSVSTSCHPVRSLLACQLRGCVRPCVVGRHRLLRAVRLEAGSCASLAAPPPPGGATVCSCLGAVRLSSWAVCAGGGRPRF